MQGKLNTFSVQAAKAIRPGIVASASGPLARWRARHAIAGGGPEMIPYAPLVHDDVVDEACTGAVSTRFNRSFNNRAGGARRDFLSPRRAAPWPPGRSGRRQLLSRVIWDWLMARCAKLYSL